MMDIVNNLDDAKSVDEANESERKVETQEQFDNVWRSYYALIYSNMQRTYQYVEDQVRLELEAACNSKFDPENNEQHRKIMEKDVVKSIPAAYNTEMFGMMMGAFIITQEFGERLGFDVTEIKNTIDELRSKHPSRSEIQEESTDGTNETNETNERAEESLQQEDERAEASSD